MENQFLLVAQVFDESLNILNKDQIALLDVVKIFLLSFMSGFFKLPADSITDAGRNPVWVFQITDSIPDSGCSLPI